MRRRARTTIALLAVVASTVAVLSGCAAGKEGTPMSVQDPSGMTLEQVEALTFEEEYELYEQRWVRMQELIRDAQLVIHDGPWRWIGVGIYPSPGHLGLGPLPGGDIENSYYIYDARAVKIEGATGDISDLDPMRKHFDTHGWETDVQTLYDEHRLWALTDDGYRIDYHIRTSGNYSITVYTAVFWGHHIEKIGDAIYERTTVDLVREESLPGDWARFPKLTDPIIQTWSLERE